MDAGPRPDPLEGIRISSHRVERIAVRAREASHTLSAWALVVETDAGPGTIACVEPTPDATFWRGDEALARPAQEDAVAAWNALRASEPAPEATPDLPQLG